MSNNKLAAALRDLRTAFADTHAGYADKELHKSPTEIIAAADEALAEHDAALAEHQEGLMIIGNPVDGFRFVGPFGCESDAVEWATQHASNETWTTATLQEPQA